ncbi:unnamed protein product [Parnassius apollo]|uniref:(apollo) hypothetical protein n=1 Tax=Parnassius apollo TaxID=110799 RepID=A0A8S3W4L6_PARAO|nr:unnamed protein product [Parnassius apollo]
MFFDDIELSQDDLDEINKIELSCQHKRSFSVTDSEEESLTVPRSRKRRRILSDSESDDEQCFSPARPSTSGALPNDVSRSLNLDRRVLEESDGEDSLFNDHEEIVEDDDVNIDEREEETVEAIAREVQHDGEMGESAHSEILSGQHENAEIPDSPITISNTPNVSSRTSRSRRIQSQCLLTPSGR